MSGNRRGASAEMDCRVQVRILILSSLGGTNLVDIQIEDEGTWTCSYLNLSLNSREVLDRSFSRYQSQVMSLYDLNGSKLVDVFQRTPSFFRHTSTIPNPFTRYSLTTLYLYNNMLKKKKGTEAAQVDRKEEKKVDDKVSMNSDTYFCRC
jgi:hypothetical protein